MERDWLRRELARGRSIQSIASEIGRAPSTVSYWVNKYGLASHHARRVARRGGVERERLTALVERGLSIREIAGELKLSQSTIRHWLARYELRTQPARYARRGQPAGAETVRECPRHGWATYRRTGPRGSFRCATCQMEAVSRRRRHVKSILIDEAGGACVICGYARYAGALHFHHLDPANKEFAIGGRGLTLSLSALRAESRKCALLCANCHAEVEGGVTRLPFATAFRGSSMAERTAVNR